MLTRLQWQVGKLHPNIYAYTNNKGTTDCLTNMLTSIKGRKTTVIFMDLEKAFEMASAEAILETLANKGVSGKLLAWTRDFLTHRQE